METKYIYPDSCHYQQILFLNKTSSFCADVMLTSPALHAFENNSILLDNVTSEADICPPIDSLPYSVGVTVTIAIIATLLSIVTAGGNLLVMISFRIDPQLQTVSNYFLLSLALADFAIGFVSMPLYSVYLLMDRWPLGALTCDLWLSMDYTMSNASVANLLIISFDRFLSVKKPLTYRAHRTTARAAAMIASAWLVSVLLWTPWIISWPYIMGKRTVPHCDCYIQFLSNPSMTLATAIVAFYLPVSIMCVLYYLIYRETEKRKVCLGRMTASRAKRRKRRRTRTTARGSVDSSSSRATVSAQRDEDSSDGEVSNETEIIRSL